MRQLNSLTIQLHVNDISRSAKYYTNVLGFHVTDSWAEEGLDEDNLPPGFWTTLLYRQEGDELMFHVTLQQNNEKSDVSMNGKLVFEIEVDNIQNQLDSVKKSDGIIIKELSTQKFKAGDSPQTVKEYKYDYFTIEDPDGFRWNLRTKDELVQ